MEMVTVEFIRKWEHWTWCFVDTYHKGLGVKESQAKVKQFSSRIYKLHRHAPERLAEQMEKAEAVQHMSRSCHQVPFRCLSDHFPLPTPFRFVSASDPSSVPKPYRIFLGPFTIPVIPDGTVQPGEVLLSPPFHSSFPFSLLIVHSHCTICSHF